MGLIELLEFCRFALKLIHLNLDLYISLVLMDRITSRKNQGSIHSLGKAGVTAMMNMI